MCNDACNGDHPIFQIIMVCIAMGFKSYLTNKPVQQLGKWRLTI